MVSSENHRESYCKEFILKMVNVTVALIGMKEFFTMINFLYHIWMAIIAFGIASNIINIIVFMGSGVRDNVSTCLLVLSFSDLSYLIIRSFSAASQYLVYHHPSWPWVFDHLIFSACTFWYGQVFYDFSCFISVFLAAVRCCCVVMPLKFKTVFTKSRTVRTLIGLFIAAICLRAPQLYGLRHIWKLNPATNNTFLSCAEARDFPIFGKINDIVNRNILSTVAYVAVAVCVVTMVVKLRDASRFRYAAAKTLVPTDPRPEKSHLKNSEKMSAKEFQLVQSVILLCVIFLFSQLPFQIYSSIRIFVPEFNTGGSQVFLFGIAYHISASFSFLNCSVNIFVYLTYNRKYRNVAYSLLCLKGGQSEN